MLFQINFSLSLIAFFLDAISCQDLTLSLCMIFQFVPLEQGPRSILSVCFPQVKTNMKGWRRCYGARAALPPNWIWGRGAPWRGCGALLQSTLLLVGVMVRWIITRVPFSKSLWLNTWGSSAGNLRHICWTTPYSQEEASARARRVGSVRGRDEGTKSQHCYFICPSYLLPGDHFLYKSLTGKDIDEAHLKTLLYVNIIYYTLQLM